MMMLGTIRTTTAALTSITRLKRGVAERGETEGDGALDEGRQEDGARRQDRRHAQSIP